MRYWFCLYSNWLIFLFNEVGFFYCINILEFYNFFYLYIFLVLGVLEMELKGMYKMINWYFFVIYNWNILFIYELVEVILFYLYVYDKINEVFGFVNLRWLFFIDYII